MSQATFYRWFNRFSEKNKQVEDKPRSGAPQSARKEENIQEVQRLVMQDRRMSVRIISEAVGISIGTVDTILTKYLKLHQVCAKFVPKILSEKNQWWFHQDNASCHESTLVTTGMANRGVKPVQLPPYSPDLAPCDFFLFPRMKDSSKEIRFQSTEELKKALENYLKR